MHFIIIWYLGVLKKINILLFSNIRIGKLIFIPVPVLIWFLLPLIAVFAELFHDKINNYLIYKSVFDHTLQQNNLYLFYPEEFNDCNHYGPFFSLIIAPFALLPNSSGVVLWVIANTWFLYYALKQLPISSKAFYIILVICAIELMTSIHNVQFNPMMTAWMILSFTMVRKGKDFWATLFIVAGFMTKIYGIVGLLFFLFSDNKLKFVASFIFWSVVLFCLPMLISSPAFIVQSYIDWKDSLVLKDTQNSILGNMQDISIQGMIRRIFNYREFPNLGVMIPGAILLGLPLLNYKMYRNVVFQLYYLALLMITVVIFSSSAESPTYIIALCGVAIWYVLNMHLNRISDKLLLAFVILLTCLSPTDLFPRYIRQNFVVTYALKALPCIIVWLVLIGKVSFAANEKLKSPEVI